MTQRSEEEVCCALNECDYDLEAAANFLIEELPQVSFGTNLLPSIHLIESVAGRLC